MTNKQVVEELRLRTKPFLYLENPKMSQSTFSVACRNAEFGISKPNTLIKFFGRFGYIGSYDNFIIDPTYVIPSPIKTI